MAITFVGGATNTSASASTLSVTHGLTINSGDVILAFVNGNDTTTDGITDNNGANAFTEAYQEAQPPAANSGQFAIFYRVAGGSEPSSYTFDQSGTDRLEIAIGVWSGVDNTTPFDVTPSASTRDFSSTTETTATTAALTTGVNEAWGVCAFYLDSSSSFSDYTNSYANEIQAGTHLQSVAVVSREFATSGSQGTASATISSARDWTAHQFSLNPASTAVTVTDVNTTESWADGATGLVITGTGFI